jgi:TRAP transporter 4TM/12TM fusion protein
MGKEIPTWRRFTSSTAGILGIFYAVVFVVFNLMTLEMQMPIITSLFLAYVFATFPFLKPKPGSLHEQGWVEIFDILLVILALAIGGYHVANSWAFIFERNAMPNQLDIVMGTISVVLVMESVRRVAGWVLVILAAIFLFYAFFGYLFPSMIAHRGYGLDRVVSTLYITKSGIFGSPTQVVTQYVILFIVMGTFLEISGGSQFLIDLARAIAGRITGGPGMVSIVSSSLFGTISGSAVANVVVDGVITIPAMKKYGFEPHMAGAIEAYTSTGGQLVPPVMGAAAFLIADGLGIPFLKVAVAAVLPAFFYYFACFSAIYFYARSIGLTGEKSEDLPVFSNVIRRAYYLTPIFLIIGILIYGYSPSIAGLVGLLASLCLCLLNRWLRSERDFKTISGDIIEGMTKAAKETSALFPICAVAGVIVGVIGLTGIGTRLSPALIALAGDNTLFLLMMIAFVALILGMGMPTTPLYVVLAATLVPALVDLHLSPLGSHLFIFYFGLLSCLTPPVAVAAYAAAPIAETSFSKVGWAAFKLSIPCFLIPFAFLYEPALLLGSGPSVLSSIWPSITCMTGIFFLSAAIIGYFVGHLPAWKRIGMGLGGCLLIDPHFSTDVIGAGLILVCVLGEIGGLIRRRVVPT